MYIGRLGCPSHNATLLLSELVDSVVRARHGGVGSLAFRPSYFASFCRREMPVFGMLLAIYGRSRKIVVGGDRGPQGSQGPLFLVSES